LEAVAAEAAAQSACRESRGIRWTLADAGEVFPAISELAEKHGFRLSMFGSVLTKGDGRDLYLLLSPFGSIPNFQARFLNEFGGVLKDYRRNVAHGIGGYLIEKDGRWYDFIFGKFWRPRGENERRS
jgi:hypothetical protein